MLEAWLPEALPPSADTLQDQWSSRRSQHPNARLITYAGACLSLVIRQKELSPSLPKRVLPPIHIYTNVAIYSRLAVNTLPMTATPF